MSMIIAGTHTGIGKTLCSAIICQALGYDYWKPVQAGDLKNSDSIFVKNHIDNEACFIHPERYKLTLPASPHYAAAMDGILIKKEDFILPKTTNKIVVETAGGIMSPLADDLLNIDLIAHLNLPVILVSGIYLGSINHTLLTVAAFKQYNIAIAGIVFSGTANNATTNFIEAHTKVPVYFSIPFFKQINQATIAAFAASLILNNN